MADIIDILGNFEAILEGTSLTPTITLDDAFYLQDFRQRKLYFNDEVNECTIIPLIRHILQYNTEDKDIEVENRKPILLYISSIGGHEEAGFQLIDVILASKTPVYVINTGYCYSMGMLIALAGEKRYAYKNAKYLLHDGTEFITGSGTKVRDQIKFRERQDERIKQYVLSHSTISSKEYDKNVRVEWFLFAEEAKSKGFVDYIIGVDAEMDEVI